MSRITVVSGVSEQLPGQIGLFRRQQVRCGHEAKQRRSYLGRHPATPPVPGNSTSYPESSPRPHSTPIGIEQLSLTARIRQTL